MIEEVGKRGMQVASLDLEAMRHHYDIRAALDALAVGETAVRARNSLRVTADLERSLESDGSRTYRFRWPDAPLRNLIPAR